MDTIDYILGIIGIFVAVGGTWKLGHLLWEYRDEYKNK